MINGSNIAAFLLEIIKYAKDEDINALLSFALNENQIYLLNIHFKDYNASEKLLLCLFGHIYGFVERKLPEQPPLIKDNGKITRGVPIYNNILFCKDVSEYEKLYLHLYALCECYYSYPFLKDSNMSDLENLKFNTLTSRQIQSLIGLLIKNYSENKFYYYFNNNKLVKLKIVEKTKNRRTSYSYNQTKYTLEDKDNTTFIINNEKNIKVDIGKPLDRFFDNLQAFNLMKYKDIKLIHSNIITAIRETDKDYCKCCNPNLNNPNSTKTCENCTLLLKNLNKISEKIDELNPNPEIYKLKNQIKRSNIYKKLLNQQGNLTEIVRKRKNKLNNAIKKLEKDTTNYKNTNPKYYKDLSCLINTTKILIKECFKN